MFEFTPGFIPARIVVFGAGGTGSRLMPPLAQLVRTCIKKHNPLAWIPALPIYVVDGDVVEEKNLTRQNFIAPDVGRNKAVVVAERYSTAFDVEIIPHPYFLGYAPENKPTHDAGLYRGEDVEVRVMENSRYFYQLLSRAIIILAVDSADARRTILSSVMKAIGEANYSEYCQSFIIDAGNEDDFGQVKFFTTDTLTPMGGMTSSVSPLGPKFSLLNNVKVNMIPMDFDYYRNLGGSVQELSCADLPQTLAINAMMATMILSVAQNFLYLKPMAYDGIRFSMKGGAAIEQNTFFNWRKRAKDLYDVTRRGTWPEFGSGGADEYYRRMQAGNLKEFKNIVARGIEETKKFFSSAGGVLQPDGSWAAPAKPQLVAKTPVEKPEEVSEPPKAAPPKKKASPRRTLPDGIEEAPPVSTTPPTSPPSTPWSGEGVPPLVPVGRMDNPPPLVAVTPSASADSVDPELDWVDDDTPEVARAITEAVAAQIQAEQATREAVRVAEAVSAQVQAEQTAREITEEAEAGTVSDDDYTPF